MKPSARLYQCLRCHKQVVICRRCDRGHRFCGEDCARLSRRDSQRRSAQRYRKTTRGKTSNVRRQQRFPQRQINRQQNARLTQITHHGSPTPARCAPLLIRRWPLHKRAVKDTVVSEIRCHCCGVLCDVFLRRHFLHSSLAP